MIKGIGCDTVEISRIEKIIGDERFLEKVYTTVEKERISSQGIETAAGIWSAKEAVCKALGTGFVGFAMRDIEICKKESGQPYVKVYKGAYDRLCKINGKNIHISITHEKSMAMAFAIVE